MKKRIVWGALFVLGAMVLTFLFFPQTVFCFDKEVSEVNKTKISDMVNPSKSGYTASFAYPLVKAFGTALGYVPQDLSGETTTRVREVPWVQSGSGTIISPGYMMTAAHVVIPSSVTVPVSSCEYYSGPVFKVLSTTVLISDFGTGPIVGWIHYVDRDRDIAIIRYIPMGIYKPTMPVPIETDGQRLEEGDILCAVVHKRGDQGEMTGRLKVIWGKVRDIGVDTPLASTQPYLSGSDFTMDMVIIPGDSGSAVYAFRDGQPVLIGVARAIATDPLGVYYASYAAWIGHIVKWALDIN